MIATGSLTNVALFVQVFPELLVDKVARIVSMAGAEGRGNKSPVAESNVFCDPHAASIVFDAPVPVILCLRDLPPCARSPSRRRTDRLALPLAAQPLNLTHTALFTPAVHRQLLEGLPSHFPPTPPLTPTNGSTTLPRALTPLRHTLSTNLTFFAEAYKTKYGMEGPPLHDALTVAFVSHPELFKGAFPSLSLSLPGTHRVRRAH